MSTFLLLNRACTISFCKVFYRLDVSEFRNSLSAPVLVALSFLGVMGSNFLYAYLFYVPLKIPAPSLILEGI